MERNPYEPGSVKWALVEEDWSDLTVGEIAEVFDMDARYIRRCISGIRQKTGYVVPHAAARARRTTSGK